MASQMDPRALRLAQAPVGRLLVSFSLPAITGMLVSSLYVVIDRAFLGNAVGADAIGGLTICMPISFAMMAVGMLIGIGSGALVSIRLGQQKKEEAERILGNAVAMTVVASLAMSTLFLAALGPLLHLFGATERTLPYATQFMRVILLGSFFQYTSFSLNAVIRAEGNPRRAMFTMFINAGLNILLDAIDDFFDLDFFRDFLGGPVYAGDVGAKVEAQIGGVAQVGGDRNGVCRIDAQRVLGRRAGVVDNLQLAARNAGFNLRFNFFESHLTSVLMEEFCGVAASAD